MYSSTKDNGCPDVKWVIFDLDGTLADIKHRLPEIKAGKYNESMDKLADDELKTDIFMLWDAMYCEGYEIAIVSGRNEDYRDATAEWLASHGIQYKELHMRKSKDYRSDYVIKQEIYDEHFRDREILFAIDDRDRVVQMWRDNGITCLQCQKGDY